jgi:hypothetical protein
MSDSKDSFDSLTNPNLPGDDPLPSDLESLHQRVLQDSALWRSGLPGTEALARQVTSLSQRKPESRQPSYRIREELQMQDPTHTELPQTAPTRPVIVIPHAAHARARGLVAGGCRARALSRSSLRSLPYCPMLGTREWTAEPSPPI